MIILLPKYFYKKPPGIMPACPGNPMREHYMGKDGSGMGILIALLSGALMSIQGVFNTEVTKQTSVWVAAGWVQVSAFAACVLLWLFTGREPIAGLMEVTPKYVLLGGIIGAFITYTVIRSMGSLGPAQAIELFGLFGVEKAPFAWHKLIGAAIAIVGIMVFER